jgi:NADPH-dependent glutamate synthase beta subunit-like oxidoreductase
MPVTVAIIGAGPSGFYTVDVLLKSGREYSIDIIDRIPAPYGLIRYGVAPDHQTTKNVSRAFEKTALRAEVQYFGNVELGRDVTLEELKSLYDVVVLAVGARLDKRLGIPKEKLKGVYGSVEFVNWYNGHPDCCNLDPDLNIDSVVVVGNGNVAIDVARVLVKNRQEMAHSDLPEYAVAAIEASPLTDVYMCGRRGPVEAKFTNVELREMGELEICTPIIDPTILPDEVTGGWSDRDRRLREKNLGTLRGFTEIEPGDRPKRVHFQFFSSPVEILGEERVEAVRFERTRLEDGRTVGTGEYFEIPCGLVVAAIGSQSEEIDGVPFDEKQGIVSNTDGWVADNVYAVGWVMRGSTGVISTNRNDAVQVADQIGEKFSEGSKPGRPELESLLAEREVRRVSFKDWKSIEAVEIANAAEGAPRRKFVSIEEMLGALS